MVRGLTMPRQTPAKRVENAVADTTARVINAVGDAIVGKRRKQAAKPARKSATKTRAKRKR
jgi:hypothetical protein